MGINESEPTKVYAFSMHDRFLLVNLKSMNKVLLQTYFPSFIDFFEKHLRTCFYQSFLEAIVIKKYVFLLVHHSWNDML